MPIGCFWALVEQIPKLRVEDDLRFINAVSCSVWGGDYAEKLQDSLSDQDDTIQEFDKEGLDQFKKLFK